MNLSDVSGEYFTDARVAASLQRGSDAANSVVTKSVINSYRVLLPSNGATPWIVLLCVCGGGHYGIKGN